MRITEQLKKYLANIENHIQVERHVRVAIVLETINYIESLEEELKELSKDNQL